MDAVAASIHGGDGAMLALAGWHEASISADDDLNTMLQNAKEHVEDLVKFFTENDMSHPISCHMVAAATLSESMLGLMSQISQLGGSISDQPEAAILLTRLASSQCELVIKESWIHTLNIIARLKSAVNGQK
jgi:hypothetical protein